jgi:GGDEF domain-containing protein
VRTHRPFLRTEAGEDPLTGLANRRQIERAIRNQIDRTGGQVDGRPS